MGKTRLLRLAFIVAVVIVAAYGFGWWRVQEMDSERCAASIQAVGASAGSERTWTFNRDSPSFEERRYESTFQMAEILLNDYVGKYCRGRSGFLWP